MANVKLLKTKEDFKPIKLELTIETKEEYKEFMKYKSNESYQVQDDDEICLPRLDGILLEISEEIEGLYEPI